MIENFKVGYKTTIFRNLLSVFDMEGGYQNAARQLAQAPRGYKGLIYGAKAVVLDAMIILNDLWLADKKYSEENGTLRCWRKAGILPASWNSEVKNSVVSAYLATEDKIVSTEDCDLMCNLMTTLTAKAETVDVNTEVYVLQDSFVEDSIDDPLEFQAMIKAWI